MTTPSTPTTTIITEVSGSQTMDKKEVDDKLELVESVDSEFEFTKDFGFLPIPKHLRYNPAKPPHFGLLLNIAFGFASTFSKHPIIKGLYRISHEIASQSLPICITVNPY